MTKAVQTFVFIILSKKIFHVFQFESFGLFTVTYTYWSDQRSPLGKQE